jgi:hypothetical protein
MERGGHADDQRDDDPATAQRDRAHGQLTSPNGDGNPSFPGSGRRSGRAPTWRTAALEARAERPRMNRCG